MKLKINDPFLKKYENQIEKMGDGGIFRIPLKHEIIINYTKRQKEEDLMNSNRKQNSLISKMKNQYNALTFDNYNKISKINDKALENEKNNEILNNDINNNININNTNNNINNKIIFNNINNVIKPKNINLKNNNRYHSLNDINGINDNPKVIQKIPDNERFYKPYSLKDYNHMMERFKKNKFGGLGINKDKAWNQRQKMFNKIKKFESSVNEKLNKKINNYNFRRIESPQKVEMMRIKQQIANSKRYIAQKYGKGVMLNKIREKKRKEKEEIELYKRLKYQNDYIKNRNRKNIINIYDNVVNQRKEDYKIRLLQLKSSLI